MDASELGDISSGAFPFITVDESGRATSSPSHLLWWDVGRFLHRRVSVGCLSGSVLRHPPGPDAQHSQHAGVHGPDLHGQPRARGRTGAHPRGQRTAGDAVRTREAASKDR